MSKSSAQRTRRRKLSLRQENFALEYAASGNGAASARRAGYSRTCDADIACRLLKDPRVRRIIDKIRAERYEAASHHARVDGRITAANAAVSVAEFLTIDSRGILRFKSVGELSNHQIQALDRVQLSTSGITEGILLKQPTEAIQELISLSSMVNTTDNQDSLI